MPVGSINMIKFMYSEISERPHADNFPNKADQISGTNTVVYPVSVRPQFPCIHSFVYFGGSKE